MDDDPSERFPQHSPGRDCAVGTPDAASRFPQAPGGTASIVLGGDCAGGQLAAVRGPVGGTATVILGDDDTRADFAARDEGRHAAVATSSAAPRFSQAPGGAASIILGGGGVMATISEVAVRHGRTAPGGTSCLVLGGNYPDDLLEGVSANKFACGANQNCGNTMTGRPTTRLHHAPGGASTICLGEEAEVPGPRGGGGGRVSSNSFACGANQNAGNVITDRPSTRLHQAPGGNSTLSLGGDYPEGRVPLGRASSNCFASGSHPNSGNSITDRSSTRRFHAPGGASTICLGVEAPSGNAPGGDENVNTANLRQTPTKQEQALGKEPPLGSAGGPPAAAVAALG